MGILILIIKYYLLFFWLKQKIDIWLIIIIFKKVDNIVINFLLFKILIFINSTVIAGRSRFEA